MVVTCFYRHCRSSTSTLTVPRVGVLSNMMITLMPGKCLLNEYVLPVFDALHVPEPKKAAQQSQKYPSAVSGDEAIRMMEEDEQRRKDEEEQKKQRKEEHECK